MKASIGPIFFALSMKSIASPLVEDFGAMSVDWSNQTLKYSVALKAPSDDWKEVEGKARDLARENLFKAADMLYVERHAGMEVSILEAQRPQVKSRLKSWTYSKHSEFGADGVIRASMEMKLKRLMPITNMTNSVAADESIAKSAAQTSASDITGIVFKMKNQTLPVATFKIKEAKLGTVYSMDQLKASAYEKNLMAKWFKAPLSPEEQKSVVGDKPVLIEITAQKNGDFLVSEAEWAKVSKVAGPLLSEAKTIILVD